jgi:hypothetical protein
MTKINTLIFFILICSQVNYSQKQIKIVQTKDEFDIMQASEMLNEGNSKINGVAHYADRVRTENELTI